MVRSQPMHRDRELAATLRIIEGAIIPAALRVHTTTLSAGVSRTVEFEKWDLAQLAINVGTKWGHGCLYCSTWAMLRMHLYFETVGNSPTSASPFVCWNTPRNGRVAALIGVWSSPPAPAHAHA